MPSSWRIPAPRVRRPKAAHTGSLFLICRYHSDIVIIANILLEFLLDEGATSVVCSGDDFLLSHRDSRT